VDFLLDGGPCEVGIESTILDLSRMDARGPVLLRPGGVSGARIAELIGIQPASPDADAPRASGTLDSHYAPNTPVALLDGQQLASVLSRLANAGRRVSLLSFSMSSSPNSVAHISLPDAPNGYAHGLYAALRELDAAKTDIILVESPPTTEEWRGINDRLNRAAHDSVRQLQYFLR
jgi:L-threonylcarbamoyladenylate synthase